MAYAGQTLENPVSGEKITFIQTSPTPMVSCSRSS